MIGAFAGDFIGSVYEHAPIKSKNFPLYQSASRFTDDSVLTLAIAQLIPTGDSYSDCVKMIGHRYADASYGGNFHQWLFSDDTSPHISWGNGAAMRVSAIGFAFDTKADVLREATESLASRTIIPKVSKARRQLHWRASILKPQGAGQRCWRSSQAALERVIGGYTMRVSEVMTSNPACCPRDMKLPDVARFMRNNDCGEIPVLDDDTSRKLVGVITDRDIAMRAVAESLGITATTVGDIMSAPVISVNREADLEECIDKMEQHQLRRIPVVDGAGGVCGIVAQADIARLGSLQETAELVQDLSRPAQ